MGIKPYKISDKCLEDFINEGFSQSEIARSCNCSRQAIHSRINKRSMLGKGEAIHEQIRQWRTMGWKYKDISKKIGKSVNNIGGIITRYYPELTRKGKINARTRGRR